MKTTPLTSNQKPVWFAFLILMILLLGAELNAHASACPPCPYKCGNEKAYTPPPPAEKSKTPEARFRAFLNSLPGFRRMSFFLVIEEPKIVRESINPSKKSPQPC